MCPRRSTMGRTSKSLKKFARRGGVRSKVEKQHSKRNERHQKDRRRTVTRKGAPAEKKRKGDDTSGDTSAAGAKKKQPKLSAKRDQLDSVAAENMDVDEFLNSFAADDGDDSGEDSSDVDDDNVWGDDDEDSSDEDMPTQMDSESSASASSSAKTSTTSEKSSKSKGAVAAHREELEKLKETDPEFYAFLQKNDQELLAFGQDEDDADAGANDGDAGATEGSVRALLAACLFCLFLPSCWHATRPVCAVIKRQFVVCREIWRR